MSSGVKHLWKNKELSPTRCWAGAESTTHTGCKAQARSEVQTEGIEIIRRQFKAKLSTTTTKNGFLLLPSSTRDA